MFAVIQLLPSDALQLVNKIVLDCSFDFEKAIFVLIVLNASDTTDLLWWCTINSSSVFDLWNGTTPTTFNPTYSSISCSILIVVSKT